MFRFFLTLALLILGAGLFAQTPQPGFTYQDKAGTTGHIITLGGKFFGPYKEITKVVQSTSGTEGMFLATKRDKTYILSQGVEAGPLGQGFDDESNYISDDGKVWAVTATHSSDEDDTPGQAQLWVNGKLIGTFQAVANFEYAETGGRWIASVQTGEDQYSVYLDGRSQGSFTSVDKVWVSPDGKYWGYAATDSQKKTVVVTQDRTYNDVQNPNFESASLRNIHWAYGFQVGDELEVIVVDGKEYTGYLNFSGLTTTNSGRHWGFSVDKLTDSGDYPVVVVDGTEYVGENLLADCIGPKELFTWTVTDGPKVTTQVLTLP